MFDNIISLGESCMIAGGMEKYGLRNWSGPFDWVSTPNFGSVLHFLETDFEDFLKLENLNEYRSSGEFFEDSVYGLIFPHEEIEESIFTEKDYKHVCLKYNNKLERFRRELKLKNCFLRSVLSQEQMKYIEENQDYIDKIIKIGNSNSELILLLHKGIRIPSNLAFRCYIMQGKYSADDWQALRGWFDGSEDFLTYMGKHFNGYQVYKNLEFDKAKGNSSPLLNILAIRYQMLLKLVHTDFDRLSVPEDIIIYGVGNIGEYFYQQIKGKCRVKCFVDASKRGKEIDGIPIVGLGDLQELGNTVFVVTPVYEYDRICVQIRRRFQKSGIISLKELLEKNL